MTSVAQNRWIFQTEMMHSGIPIGRLTARREPTWSAVLLFLAASVPGIPMDS